MCILVGLATSWGFYNQISVPDMEKVTLPSTVKSPTLLYSFCYYLTKVWSVYGIIKAYCHYMPCVKVVRMKLIIWIDRGTQASHQRTLERLRSVGGMLDEERIDIPTGCLWKRLKMPDWVVVWPRGWLKSSSGVMGNWNAASWEFVVTAHCLQRNIS